MATRVVVRARVVVVASIAVGFGQAAASHCVAAVVGAGVAVVAAFCLSWQAVAIGAQVAHGARIAVIAAAAWQVDMVAAGECIATVKCARVFIVADQSHAARA